MEQPKVVASNSGLCHTLNRQNTFTEKQQDKGEQVWASKGSDKG